MPAKIILATGAIVLLFSVPVFADDMTGMDMSKPMGDHSPSSRAFAAVDAKMHTNMAITYSGDADVDFLRGMIPHHQGAIDMAKVELQYGKDPQLRKLAQTIIDAQEAETKEMNAWLKTHGK